MRRGQRWGFEEQREVRWHLQGDRTALSPWCVREGLPRGWNPPQHLCHSPSPPFVPAASAGLLENCTGCVLCSEDNGCITCHHRLFLLIWRDGIRQYGMCVHTCPPGYFGVRGLEVNRCTSTSRASRGPPAPTSAPAPLATLRVPVLREGRWLHFPQHPRWHWIQGQPGWEGFVPFSLAQSLSLDPAGLGSPVGAGGVPG